MDQLRKFQSYHRYILRFTSLKCRCNDGENNTIHDRHLFIDVHDLLGAVKLVSGRKRQKKKKHIKDSKVDS